MNFRHSDKFLFCCLVRQLENVEECLPAPDQFSSCEDLIRERILRVAIWFLGISAFLGNAFVLFKRFKYSNVTAKKGHATRVQSIMVSHLAVSDCIMGVYMLIIACADAKYRERYAYFAEQWQTSFVCKFAGFLSMLSSEASVFFMCVISIDRFVRISFPFSKLRLNPKSAHAVAGGVWLTACLISFLPVMARGYFGDAFYGRSTVCLALPLTKDRPSGWQYSVGVFLVLNMVAFIVMVACYISIYVTVKYASRRLRRKKDSARNDEIQLAIRMSLIIISDLCCWMPIIILGFLSLSGAVTVPSSIYAWTAVFILPLNSSLNPYLYTIMARERPKRTNDTVAFSVTNESVINNNDSSKGKKVDN